MSNFIDLYTRHCDSMESPTSYITWSAIGVLCAILKDNIYHSNKYGKTYPNMYIFIVAKSSATRKDPPIRLAEKLIREIDSTKIIAGRATIQSVLKILSENFTSSKGTKQIGGRAVLLSKELSDLLVDDDVATKIITDWYDCHDIWENSLVSTGVLTLNNVCLTILAASNDILFKDVFRKKEVYGGLLARSIIISENKRRKKNSRMYDNIDEENHEKVLVEHLKKLSKMKGEVIFSDPAKKFYDEWYHSLDDDKFDKAGVIARMHTNVEKLSMVLAAAHFDFSLRVELKDVEQALKMCTGTLKNYQGVSMGGGSSVQAEPTTLIIQELLMAKDRTRSKQQLLKKLLGDLDSEMLEKCIQTLTDADIVKVCAVQGGIAYTLTDRFISLYEQKSTIQ